MTQAIQFSEAMPKAERSTQFEEYLSLMVGPQTFGIPVLQVQDVLSNQNVAAVPLSPAEISGSINLRGRIVTVIDMRVVLGLEPFSPDQNPKSVVVEHGDEAYSLLVDEVGEVLELNVNDCEPNPANLTPKWRELSNGLFRLENELLMALDVSRIVGIPEKGETN